VEGNIAKLFLHCGSKDCLVRLEFALLCYIMPYLAGRSFSAGLGEFFFWIGGGVSAGWYKFVCCLGYIFLLARREFFC